MVFYKLKRIFASVCICVLYPASCIATVIGDTTNEIMQLQEFLNKNYQSQFDHYQQRSDGFYDRGTHKNFVRAFQIEVGTSIGEADGLFGKNTERKFQETVTKNGYSEKLTYLLQYALHNNGSPCQFNGQYDDATKQAVINFQKFIQLEPTGIIDAITARELFSTRSSENRPKTAFDCAYHLTYETAKELYAAGYRVAGRYLTSPYKSSQSWKHAVTIEEIKNICKAGLQLVLFFQEGIHNSKETEYFSEEHGKIDGEKILTAIQNLQGYTPKGTVIFVTIDDDKVAEKQIKAVIAYMKSVSEIVTNAGYKMGVYGSILICNKIREAGFADFSYVAGMSYGWGGNYGYNLAKLPNWAFKQFSERKNGATSSDTGVKFNIDDTVASGLYNGFCPDFAKLDNEVLPKTEEKIDL